MTFYQPPETVLRCFTENGCVITGVIADPADQQQLLYGTVTRAGTLVGSYYPQDRIRQTRWRVVTANGHHLSVASEPAAVVVLTTTGCRTEATPYPPPEHQK